MAQNLSRDRFCAIYQRSTSILREDFQIAYLCMYAYAFMYMQSSKRRTTLQINDRLLKRAKQHASQHGTTLKQVFEHALHHYLQRKPAPGRRRFRLQWEAVKGDARPGVDLSDRKSLYEKMEESD